MPQDVDVEQARQEYEAKDERHAGELKTVKDGYEAEMKAKDEQHAEELKAVEAKYEDKIQDLETKFQEVETGRGTLEVNLRQKVVD